MQKQHKFSMTGILSVLFVLLSCSENITDFREYNVGKEIDLSGQIHQENVTRANDYGFVTGDRMGIYVVDYQNGAAGTLGAFDNRAQNVLFTYDEDSYRWTSPTKLYWRDEQTPIDVYGYYPGINYIENPFAYKFEVQTDQSTEAINGDLAGYEQSDLLWGKASRVEPTAERIVVKYGHILAGVRVHLIKGEGMTDVEWEKLEKIVLVENTVRGAEVNLATGMVSPDAKMESLRSVRMAPQSDNYYRAVVIPQTVDAGKTLISITLDGQTYSHSLSTDMVYNAGKLHDFTLTVNKREAEGDYGIALAYDGISPWINDESSHNFTATAYVTVNCDEPGKLKECITKAGYDCQTIQNLKVIGCITTEDFTVMRDEMPKLTHLNLKEVRIAQALVGSYYDNGWVEILNDDAIPASAFYGNKSIRSLALPDSLKRVGSNAFREMRLMYSTLEIPEGVTYIDAWGFAFNDYNGMELIIPYTVDSITEGAFYGCNYSCEFRLNDNIKYIGLEAFLGTANFHGVFHVPSNLKSLSAGAFREMGRDGSFTGEIEIPQGITEIPDRVFSSIAFKNRIGLKIPDGVRRIGNSAFPGRLSSLQFNNDLLELAQGAFQYVSIPFPIELPNSLLSIGNACFMGCGIEGELVIPEKCLSIGNAAFSNNSITKLTLPSKLEYIAREAFCGNGMLTSVTIPRYVDLIDEYAFSDDGALQTVVCLNPEPPVLGNNAFNGVYFDKCILEVPEASVGVYRNADGWKQFKNITAYHELAFNIPEIITLDKGNTLTGIIRAEGAWEVAECPDWVTITPLSGTSDERKAELTVTVKPNSGYTREGQIVFRLKDKEYTTYTTVKQVSCEYKEDEQIVLQTASAGAPYEIPLFIIGDGYNAEDIASGEYMSDMREQMEHLFAIEPYKTYRNYFTVSTAIAVSPERGIDGLTRFNTGCYGNFYGDYNAIWKYAQTYGKSISSAREGQSTIMVLLNTNQLCNVTQMEDNGRSISLMGKSTDSYPYTQREFVQREIGGVAFGKLGVESVNHFTFLKSCTCPGCSALSNYQRAKSLGWYENISISGKMNEVPWGHLIFDSRYSQYVDVYEGGYNHARGVYRSENQSIMGDVFIPYFNTISRQSIVRRILEYSGEGYTVEKFEANDKREYPE